MSAPKGNSFAKGNKGGGRHSRYKPEYARIAEKMCTMGATTADLAEAFGVAPSTICLWQTTQQEFSESIRLGKSVPDDRVERSLYERAVGYAYDAVKVMQYKGRAITVQYREYLPPDTAACRFWLINRRKEQWADTHKLTHDAEAGSPLAALARELAGTSMRPKEDE
jgi:hypothetical protein